MIIFISILVVVSIFIGGLFLKGINGTDGGTVVIMNLLYGIPISILIGVGIGLLIKSSLNKSK